MKKKPIKILKKLTGLVWFYKSKTEKKQKKKLNQIKKKPNQTEKTKPNQKSATSY
jgi:hypothetical protein